MIYGEVIPQRRRILLIEDNRADARLAIKVLREANDINDIVHISDGEGALKFLNDAVDNQSCSMPDLIILDLNLPGVGGKEILASIKRHNALMHIPVIILTSSDSESDIYDSFKGHANAYVKKSVDLYEFMDVLRAFKKFWLQSAKLPRACS